jgi:hypothetical protein
MTILRGTQVKQLFLFANCDVFFFAEPSAALAGWFLDCFIGLCVEIQL